MRQHEDDILDALGEQYLDELHEGGDPPFDSFDCHVFPHLREELHNRLVFIRRMHSAGRSHPL